MVSKKIKHRGDIRISFCIHKEALYFQTNIRALEAEAPTPKALQQFFKSRQQYPVDYQQHIFYEGGVYPWHLKSTSFLHMALLLRDGDCYFVSRDYTGSLGQRIDGLFYVDGLKELSLKEEQLILVVSDVSVPITKCDYAILSEDILLFHNNIAVCLKFKSLPLYFMELIRKRRSGNISDKQLYTILEEMEQYDFVLISNEKCPFIKIMTYKQSTFKVQSNVSFGIAGTDVTWAYNQDGVHIHAGGKKGMYVRNPNWEADALKELKSLHFYESGGCWNLLPIKKDDVFLRLQELGWSIYADDDLKPQPVEIVKGMLALDIQYDQKKFTIDANIVIGNEEIPAVQILSRLDSVHGQINLSQNRVLELDEGSMKRLDALKPCYDVHKGRFLLPAFWGYHLAAMDTGKVKLTMDEVSASLLRSISDFKKIEEVKVPKAFKGTLRSYQKEGLNWLAFLNRYQFGGILADDMGLGKTAQVISFLLYKKEMGQTLNLVAMPKSLLFNWENEVKKFAPSLKYYIYHGKNRNKNFVEEGIDVVFTTYAMVRNDLAIFKEVAFDAVFLDESQAIKNVHSFSATSVLKLNTRFRLCITGTPIENHVGELWSQFRFAFPDLMATNDYIIKQFIDNPSPGRLQELKKIIFPFILRRKKQEVAKDLPEKVEQTIYCEMTDAQKMFYEKIRYEGITSLNKKIDKDGLNKSKMHVLESLLRLRQAACYTGLQSGVAGESGKLDNLVSMVESIYGDDHKILVFSQFVSMLGVIRKELESRKISYLYLDGATENRGDLVNRFQTSEEPLVFLISLKTGGVGLNLTAADYVFLYDPWWNPAVENQAIDRTHRIGQNKTVFAYRLISKGTVEEKIMLLKEKKEALAAEIITSEKSLLSSLTKADLDYLFS